ncbi:MAG TPA: UDP-N-acetylmuramoyl-L-alanyl-D-glutamate--2,6-diaminopimelate ligase [Chloroflexota bacterium]
MLIGELARAVPGAALSGPSDLEVRAIQTDSRRVGPGDLFVAYPGVSVDSHRFLPDALARGARAVVVERPLEVPPGVARLVVPSGRAAWAWLSAAWHDFPSRRLTVVGVAGTDGKTTTSSLIGAILAAAGRPVGLVTTVAAEIAGQSLDTGFHTTTPEPPEIQAYLADMVDRGTEVAVLETTSHALALDKVLGIDYDLAVITNVTHEHLDFHGSWEAYLEAKARLFRGLSASARKPGVPKVAVLNVEDRSYGHLRDLPFDRRLSYALAGSADLTAGDLRLDAHGSSFVAATPIGDIPIRTRLLGRFNVANALAAIGAAVGLGVEADAIRRGLASFGGVPGRLEAIDQGQPFGVVVDFAHTPNSLRRVLELGRSISGGKLAVVFGCAGLRDSAKRPLMGRAAAELADRVYLTAEDPRSEPIGEILDQIAAGVRAGGREPSVVPERGEAIAAALAAAQPGDLVLITGKGHEQSMAFGEEERPWDDRRAAREALARLGYRAPARVSPSEGS